jgi:hypothetical protein
MQRMNNYIPIPLLPTAAAKLEGRGERKKEVTHYS